MLERLLGADESEVGDLMEQRGAAGVAEPCSDEVSIELIDRNPWQPRREFDGESLAELVSSISRHGILQPLLVRPHDHGYQLIAGERRRQHEGQRPAERVEAVHRTGRVDHQHARVASVQLARLEQVVLQDLHDSGRAGEEDGVRVREQGGRPTSTPVVDRQFDAAARQLGAQDLGVDRH